MAGKRGNGEGTIRQRTPQLWEARVTLADGTRRSLYGATYQEARSKLAMVTRDRDRGLPVTNDERQTLAVYLTSWLETKRPPALEPRTWERYEALVRVHIIPALQPIQKVEA